MSSLFLTLIVLSSFSSILNVIVLFYSYRFIKQNAHLIISGRFSLLFNTGGFYHPSCG